MNDPLLSVPINLSKRKIVLVDCLALPQKSGRQSVMKKFLVAMIIVCLSVALCSSAMAQGPGGHRGGPAPGFHGGGPGPSFHGGGPGPAFRPAPPPGPGFYRPAPPPPPPRYYPNYYYRSYYYPNYYPGYYYPGTGVYLNTPGFGFSISL